MYQNEVAPSDNCESLILIAHCKSHHVIIQNTN